MGAGKTTTGRLLADMTDALFVGEDFTRSPFLTRFYNDPATYACASEVVFSLLHWAQLREARATGRNIVSDFAMGNAPSYAKNILTDADDWRAFNAVHERNVAATPPADVTVFLDIPLDVVMSRIERRVITENRPYEAGVTIEYLTGLRAAFIEHLDTLTSPVVRIPLTGSEAPETVAATVLAAIRRLTPPERGLD
jgi:deoxyadenosine/deoxycytidine kinase